MAKARTVVATGATSGLGLEAVKQLLTQSNPYKLIIGARDVKTAHESFNKIEYDSSKHTVSILPLDLANLATVKSFTQKALAELHNDAMDILFLNAGMNKAAKGAGLHGSQWCEAYVVNHLSQHYLTHLLHEKIVSSHTRVVVVSSGLVSKVQADEIPNFATVIKADAGTDGFGIYRTTKFIQLLNAHWWRRQLGSSATVLAVSPGFVPGTGLGRHLDKPVDVSTISGHFTVPEGAQNLLRGFDQGDLPNDPEEIFLSSTGEWWPTENYKLSLDRNLQEHWSPSKKDIESEAGIEA